MKKYFVRAVVCVVLLVVALTLVAQVLQQWLWIRQLNYAEIFWSLLSVKWGMACVAFVGAFLFLWLNIRQAAGNSFALAEDDTANKAGPHENTHVIEIRGITVSRRAVMRTMAVTAVALFGALAASLGLGIWVGLALLTSASLMLGTFTNIPLGAILAQYSINILTTPDLVALPLFIIMGEFLFRTRLSQSLFSGLAPWAGLLPGRLLHVNIIACTVFASISGSSAATTQVVGRMSLSELLRRGYDRNLAIGSLAGAGTLGFLIPPSTIMIIYGVLGQESILRLFAAGVLPGVVLSGLFIGYIAIRALLNPKLVPESERALSKEPFGQRVRVTTHLVPVFGLILLILGSMYFGLATPTEAAAVGVLGAAVVAALDRTLTWAAVKQVAFGSAQTCAMIGLIMMGATVLSTTSTILGFPDAINGWVEQMNLPPIMLIAIMLAVYLVLGCFMDGFSMIVTTLPVFLPMAEAAGFDKLWFGIFIIIAVEMSQVTPPVGFNLFVINGLTGDKLSYIARVTLPFLMIMVVMVFLLVQFPGIALWLPDHLFR